MDTANLIALLFVQLDKKFCALKFSNDTVKNRFHN